MPLQLTGAYSSRITKRGAAATSSLSRSSSSPFATSRRKKPSQSGAAAQLKRSQTETSASEERHVEAQPLNDLGRVDNLAPMHRGSADVTGTPPTNSLDSKSPVLNALNTITSSMFDEIPLRAGMNSVRIAEVLNYRKVLPPIVSLQHLHALVDDPTATEREVANLTEKGKLRRLLVPGRGTGMIGVGDGVVKVEDWERRIHETSIDASLKHKFIHILRQNPKAVSLSSTYFTPSESNLLIKAGLLVSSTPSRDSLNLTSYSSSSQSLSHSKTKTPSFLLSLPNTGPYLRLLSLSRAHLLFLLNSKHTHTSTSFTPCMPLSQLRDLWNGHVDFSSNSAFSAKRIRGEFQAEVLPGKTKRWKVLYGVGFEWVLGEAVGAGQVEVFETGSVGWGVRVL